LIARRRRTAGFEKQTVRAENIEREVLNVHTLKRRKERESENLRKTKRKKKKRTLT